MREALSVRPYAPADRGACLALFDSNRPDYFADQERALFAAFLDAPEGPYYVMEDAAGDVLACGGFTAAREDPSMAVLTWGMVRRDRHRTGLGTRFLSERRDRIAANPAFRAIGLETTPASSGFFARFGFRTLQTETDGFGPGLDRVVMRCDPGEDGGTGVGGKRRG